MVEVWLSTMFGVSVFNAIFFVSKITGPAYLAYKLKLELILVVTQSHLILLSVVVVFAVVVVVFAVVFAMA